MTGDSPEGEDPTDEDEEETPIERNPSVTLDKSVDLNSVSLEGVVLNYTLVVKNTGNVTLSSGTLTDPKTGLSVPGVTLAPGEEKSYSTTYTVTLQDLLSGEPIVNIAQVNLVDGPTGTPYSAQDDAVVLIDLTPSIELTKTADRSTISGIGDVINYTLTVTNTGTAPLVNVEVNDPLTGFEAQVNLLLPGQVREFVTSYTVTAGDLENPSVLNVATVTAQTPSEEEVSDQDEVSVGVEARQIIANDDEFGSHFLSFGGVIGNILDNDLLEGQRPDPADVDFEFTELDGIIGLLIDENGELSLIPGVNEVRDYTLKYILRETAFPDNNDDALVFFRILNDNVDLSVTKTSFEAEIYEGDEFEYQIVVSNIGGTPATQVNIVDNLPANVSYVSSGVVSVSDPQIQVGNATVNGSTVTWTVPFLPADGEITLRIRVRAGDAGQIRNVVTVDSGEEDTNGEDNEATDENEILPFRIPNVITPNGDGDNDTFEIKGLGKFASSEIVILNRLGDHVLEKKEYQNDWDAPGQVAGTYFYVLKLTDGSGKVHEFKGWIQVIKE
nr:gliding motility-associated C-terminal domain-containing protein [Algoriphagus terrigena]